MKILSFDVEDWFHILDHPLTRSEREWSRFPSRLESNVQRILDALEETTQRATFFCLGWVARNYPNLVHGIVSRGHEVACHSDMHQLVYDLGPDRFRRDLQVAKRALEDASGQAIVAYRAPGFSVTERETGWFFEILGEEGFQVDCSVFPGHHGHGGLPHFPTSAPCSIRWSGGLIREFPMSRIGFFGLSLVYSGGGYFRLTPYPVINAFAQAQEYLMTYFHPRDFDPEQPIVPGLSLVRRFKSYHGLANAMSKLKRLMRDVELVDLRTATASMMWTNAPVVALNASSSRYLVN